MHLTILLQNSKYKKQKQTFHLTSCCKIQKLVYTTDQTNDFKYEISVIVLSTIQHKRMYVIRRCYYQASREVIEIEMQRIKVSTIKAQAMDAHNKRTFKLFSFPIMY